MLLLAHLLTRNDRWRNRTIRLLRTVENEAGVDDVRQHLVKLIERSRIKAVPKVVLSKNPLESIQAESQSAAITMLGFEPPEEGDELEFFHRMETLVGGLKRVVFVSSLGGMSIES